jgi:hypothetical protein
MCDHTNPLTARIERLADLHAVRFVRCLRGGVMTADRRPKTVREATVGKTVMRLLQVADGYKGVLIADGKVAATLEGDAPDALWTRLRNEVGKADPNYVGYAGALQRFQRFFPEGFSAPGYEARERAYKVRAKSALDAAAPLEAAASGAGFGEAALAAYRSTNLLSPFEKVRLQDVLRSPAADDFVRTAAAFALGDTRLALRAFDRLLKPFGIAKWTAVTYLPFLWRPDAHMFLKPEVTKGFAARVAHTFATTYAAQLDPSVYESLLDMTAETEREIAALAPRDRIDVQSFIYVIGEYR